MPDGFPRHRRIHPQGSSPCLCVCRHNTGNTGKRIWTNVYLPCPYSWYERIRLEVAAFGGMIRETQFGADVELDLLLPEGQTQGFLERVTDLSAGTIEGLIGKQEYRAFPLP